MEVRTFWMPILLYFCMMLTLCTERIDAVNIEIEITNTIKLFNRIAPNSARKYLPALEEMRTRSKTIKGNQEQEAVAGAISAIRNNMGSLLSGDPVKTVQGVLDMLSPTIALTGPVGLAMSGVLSLLSGFLGMVGGGSADFDSSLNGIVRKELERARNLELISKAHGTLEQLKTVSVFLDGFTRVNRCPLSPSSRNTLGHMWNYAMDHTFIGEMRSEVASCAVKTGEEDAKSCIQLISAYIKMRTQSHLQLTRTMLVYEGCERNSADTIDATKSVIEEQREADRRFFPFLHFPGADKIVIASIYQPLPEKKYPDIEHYLHSLQIEDLPSGNWLNTRTAIYTSPSLHNSFAYVHSGKEGWLTINKHDTSLPNTAKFYFERREDGYWTIRSVEWPSWYIYVSKTATGQVKSYNGDPGPQGYFNLILLETKNGDKTNLGRDLVISTAKWPTYVLREKMHVVVHRHTSSRYYYVETKAITSSQSLSSKEKWYLKSV